MISEASPSRAHRLRTVAIASAIACLPIVAYAPSAPTAEAYCRTGMSTWTNPGTPKGIGLDTTFPSGMRAGLKKALEEWNQTGSSLRYKAPTYTGGWKLYTFNGAYASSPLFGGAPGYAQVSSSGALPPFNSKHTGGTLYFNSKFTWNNKAMDVDNGKADVQTVAVHEVGHFTGLAHPWQPHCQDGTALTADEKKSVMYAVKTGTRRTLGADDIKAVKALY